MTERIHLSWSRDDEGVITIYATDENTGRIAEVADFWTKPMRERLGFRREYAKGVQQQLAETLVWNWNGPPGGPGDYYEGIQEGWKAGAAQERSLWVEAIENYFDATAVEDVEGYVRRARAALEAREDDDLVCVNAHDRCYGGAGGPCPYCERRPAPEPGEVERRHAVAEPGTEEQRTWAATVSRLMRERDDADEESERLRAENERLREALQGLANALEVEPGPRGVMDLVPPALDRARAALAEGESHE